MDKEHQKQFINEMCLPRAKFTETPLKKYMDIGFKTAI